MNKYTDACQRAYEDFVCLMESEGVDMSVADDDLDQDGVNERKLALQRIIDEYERSAS